MKPSHLSTPRQLADCMFVEGHPSIERTHRRANAAAVIVCIVVLCVIAGLRIAGVWR